jgi:hypothetical protein
MTGKEIPAKGLTTVEPNENLKAQIEEIRNEDDEQLVFEKLGRMVAAAVESGFRELIVYIPEDHGMWVCAYSRRIPVPKPMHLRISFFQEKKRGRLLEPTYHRLQLVG